MAFFSEAGGSHRNLKMFGIGKESVALHPAMERHARKQLRTWGGSLFCRLRCETSKRYHEENVVKTALPMLSVSLFFAGSLFTVFGKNTRRVFA
jgi:hypothetical protein